MKQKHFSGLLALTVLVILALVFLGGDESPTGTGTKMLLPGLSMRINDVSTLVVSRPEGVQVTLRREDQRWTIAELDSYPADWEAVRDLLASLVQAEILENKTSNPEYYARLGVEDLDTADASGTGISISAGEQSWSLISGDRADMQDGQYVRLAGSAQSVLIDRELEAPGEAIDWADRQILDLGAALVAEVVIRHADGEEVRLRKVSADDTDYKLVTLPEGREVQSAYTVNSMAGMFSMLRMDDVRRYEGSDSQPHAVVTVTLFTGVEVVAEVIDIEEASWLRFTVNGPANEDVEPNGEETEVTVEDPAAMASELSASLDGWLFEISATRVDTMTRRNDDLLKPLDDAAADQG